MQMCVACGQFTGPPVLKHKAQADRPALYKKEKFLEWTGTMTPGASAQPSPLHMVPGPTSKETHTCSGERCVRRCLRENTYRWTSFFSLLYRADNRPFKHSSGERVIEYKKILVTPHTHLLLGRAAPSSHTFACHAHYKNKTIYGLFKVPFINLSS